MTLNKHTADENERIRAETLKQLIDTYERLRHHFSVEECKGIMGEILDLLPKPIQTKKQKNKRK